MAYKFLKETDFDYKIRNEILTILKGATNAQTKMDAAENAALAQVRQYIGSRYDCTDIFSKADDARDAFMIQVIIVIMLYQLYGQTGMKDMPTHRKEDYGDTIKWLDEVGKGERNADLPSILSDENQGDVRIWSKPLKDWDY